MTQNQKQGEELSQLSRFLFNKSANNWYASICIEAVAGIVSVVVALNHFSDDLNTFMALVGFALLVTAYMCRMRFDDLYSTAETMRRQSVLSEGIDWQISMVQFKSWRLKAGKKIINKFKVDPRPEDYFATKEQPGPKRLLEMTAESAFWTEALYRKLKFYIWLIFAVAFIFLIIIIGLLPMGVVTSSIQAKIVYGIYLVLPLLLTIDLFGWAIKLGNLANSIHEIAIDLERIQNDPKPEAVLRLVSEYNCQHVSGFPIPRWFFNYYHDEIDSMWKIQKENTEDK